MTHIKTLKHEDHSLTFKGILYGSRSFEQVFKELQKTPIDSLEVFLNSLKGHFAFIYQSPHFTLCTVDKCRSYPIFYTKNDTFRASFSPVDLLGDDYQINQHQEQIFQQAGYTFGNETLIKDLYVLLAGEFIILEMGKDHYSKNQYFRLFPNTVDSSQKNFSDYKEDLKNVLLNIFKDVIHVANGREILIPLSAGYDSRLVLTILSHLGYKNIKTFSYGIRDNFESKVAEKLAHKLGYEWKFFETTSQSQREYYKSPLHESYISYCNDYCSTPFQQDVAVIDQIKNSSWAADDCIFINGNSGDFISGGHLLKTKSKNSHPEEELIHSYIQKHCALWDSFSIQEISPVYREELEKSLSKVSREMTPLTLALEQHELVNRQSKYVINGQRCYEFFGYDWLLPLWHDDIMEFFKEVPLEHKYDQHLYKALLHEVNWGNVWTEIPVNKKEIKPDWIKPLRLALKVCFAPFGKSFWHKVEKKVFQYFLDLTRNFAVVGYWENLFSKNIARSHVSWHSHLYLKRVKDKTLK
ncbi:MAG: asparagine synthase C-terminal domain-containing protein [Bdellovibrionota bacterium]|nr:asparagine synthase C-terminal domain-containing protein [Bdellovibrionota bacterium]